MIYMIRIQQAKQRASINWQNILAEPQEKEVYVNYRLYNIKVINLINNNYEYDYLHQLELLLKGLNIFSL